MVPAQFSDSIIIEEVHATNHEQQVNFDEQNAAHYLANRNSGSLC